MKAFLIALLLTFLALGISMETAEAQETERLRTNDVICATLAFNAGYTEKGEHYSRLVQPFYASQQEYIQTLVYATHGLVQRFADQDGVHPVQVYRDLFNEKCNMPFA